jgi:hypothetical protein
MDDDFPSAHLGHVDPDLARDRQAVLHTAHGVTRRALGFPVVLGCCAGQHEHAAANAVEE